jgi:cobalt-zinc-cadmium efflux system protein
MRHHAHGPPGGHDRAVGHAAAGYRHRLAATAVLTAAFFVTELTVGLIAESLALISDAAHMATDVVALGASWLATHLAGRRDRTGQHTYGYYRLEVLASGFIVLLMLGSGTYVLIEAATRLQHPGNPRPGLMAVVAVAGLGVNVLGMLLLRTGASAAMNVRAAYLEVFADAAASVGVLAAAGLIALTGSAFWDSVVGAGIAVFVLVRALILGRHVVGVLAQRTPTGIDPAEVSQRLARVTGVLDVHDLHLWELTSGMNVATAHLVIREGDDPHPVLDDARDLLADRFGIVHATLQVEPDTHTGCQEIAW